MRSSLLSGALLLSLISAGAALADDALAAPKTVAPNPVSVAEPNAAKRPVIVNVKSVMAGLPVAEYGRIEVDLSGVNWWMRPLLNRRWIERRIRGWDDVVRYRRGAPGVYRVMFSSNGSTEGGNVRAFISIDAATKNLSARGQGEGARSWIRGVVPSSNPLSVPLDKEDIRAYPFPLPDPNNDSKGRGRRGTPYPDGGSNLTSAAPFYGARIGASSNHCVPNNKDAIDNADRRRREAEIADKQKNDEKQPSKKAESASRPEPSKADKKRDSAPDPAPRKGARTEGGGKADTSSPDPTPFGKERDRNRRRRRGDRVPSSIPLYDRQYRNFRSDAATLAFDGALQRARGEAEIDFAFGLRAALGLS